MTELASLLVLLWCAIWASAFVVLYSLSPWYKSILGRLVMAHSFSLALILIATFLTGYVGPFTSLPYAVYMSLGFVCFGFVGLSTFAMTMYLAISHKRLIQRSRRSKEEAAS